MTDPQPRFTDHTDQKTICIIGAGPAGLAALQTVLDSEQYKSGKWLPVVFESRDDIGGIWYVLNLLFTQKASPLNATGLQVTGASKFC